MNLTDEHRRQFALRSWWQIFDLLPSFDAQLVLDLGCGIGDQAAELVARGARVIGVDSSDAMLASAKARAIPKAEFRRLDLGEPLGIESHVDGIWCSFTAAYFPELVPRLTAWKEHLKPGGWGPNRAANGDIGFFVAAQFDYLAREPAIHLAELLEPPYATGQWTPQASATRIDDAAADALRQLWARRTGAGAEGGPDEITGRTHLFEGASRSVTVNAYERNAHARRRCGAVRYEIKVTELLVFCIFGSFFFLVPTTLGGSWFAVIAGQVVVWLWLFGMNYLVMRSRMTSAFQNVSRRVREAEVKQRAATDEVRSSMNEGVTLRDRRFLIVIVATGPRSPSLNAQRGPLS